MSKLNLLEPSELFSYFEEICSVPRPSKKEEKIREYLVSFARKHGLDVKTDKVGNVLITKPAVAGRENAPVLILQTHMDMVCEKNSDVIFDFDHDPIIPYVDEGWVKARGTTLGADCGIGIAAQLALLTSKEVRHGTIECLFTVDEETGLTGANALEAGFFTGHTLLNLDSEDEGELFIGCAGGIDTVASVSYKKEPLPAGFHTFKISVSGLIGGHSGDDIHKNRGNANKILNRFLWNNCEKMNMRIAMFNGGNLRNAIAREAFAIVSVPKSKKENLVAEFNIFSAEVEFEFKYAEPNLKLSIGTVENPETTMDSATADKLINAVYACPHGVLEMSTRMPGMVETSTNLASVKVNDDKIVVTTSQRSEIESRKHDAANMVESVFRLAGYDVLHSDGYPGWTPAPESEIVKLTAIVYRELFGNEPVVRSIHAGLECGLFLEKYPQLQMVSFGPTIRGAHSPDERLDILTVQKFWKLLVEVVERV